jgi:hypothetical protein
VDALMSVGYQAIDNLICMKKSRDLLVLFKKELMNAQALEQEVASLHNLLFTVEELDHFVAAHELIDLTKYTIQNNSVEIKKSLKRKKANPFVFLNNKN